MVRPAGWSGCGSSPTVLPSRRGGHYWAAKGVIFESKLTDQDRSNCRREENTDRHVAARVMSTSKPDPLPVRSTRTTS